MKEAIDPVSAGLRLSQLLGEDELLAQAPMMAAGSPAAPAASLSGNPFEDVLARAIESLESVSKSEIYANQMIDKYVKGEADLQEVMIAQSKMSIMAQMAVTSVNAAVNTFKEITQMQI